MSLSCRSHEGNREEGEEAQTSARPGAVRNALAAQ
jgi:hypothetical protein